MSGSSTILREGADIGFSVTRQLKSAFLDPARLPWTPWVMEDTWFKLFSINPQTGGFAMFLKVGPDNIAPIHGHVGAVEGVILEGGFAYENDWGHAGWYVAEPGGVNHKPRTGPNGMVMFAVVYGPLLGYGDGGEIAAVIDAKAMYALAESAGVAGHLEKPAHWDHE